MENKTIKILQTTLERSPELWDSRRQLADLLWKEGDIEGTAKVLSAAPQWPSGEADLEFAANVFAHTNHAYSVELYQAVLERNPDNARAHAALARLHMEDGDAQATREHYLAAIALEPEAVDPHVAAWLDGDASEPIPPEPPEEEKDEKVAGARIVAARVPTVPPPGTREENPAEASAVSHLAPAPAAAPLLTREVRGGDKAPCERFEMASVDHLLELAAAEQEVEVVEEEKRQRKASLVAAAVAHVAIAVGLYFWIVHDLHEEALIVVASEGRDPGPPLLQKKYFVQSVQRKPNPAASSAVAKIISSNVASPINFTDIQTMDPDLFGLSDSFGTSFGIDQIGEGGGEASVMFFGESVKVSHAVFVVDFSGSMSKGNRIDKLKSELDASLSMLPEGVSYNVIYYSHVPWLGGETADNAPFRNPEKERDRIPWLEANRSNIQRSREEVTNMRAGGATNWLMPLQLALAMRPKPEVIWLFTDGKAADREEVIVEMDTINPGPKKVRINTIGMEIGGPAFQNLIEIAERTGGKFSIVIGGEIHTGEDARKFADPEYDHEG